MREKTGDLMQTSDRDVNLFGQRLKLIGRQIAELGLDGPQFPDNQPSLSPD
jgi:hypothetical protein